MSSLKSRTVIPYEEAKAAVVRHPGDYRVAIYWLRDIDDMHWRDTSGGAGVRTGRSFLYGYVMCDGMISGELAHSCRHGPAPHRILVCLQRNHNTDIWPLLRKIGEVSKS